MFRLVSGWPFCLPGWFSRFIFRLTAVENKKKSTVLVKESAHSMVEGKTSNVHVSHTGFSYEDGGTVLRSRELHPQSVAELAMEIPTVAPNNDIPIDDDSPSTLQIYSSTISLLEFNLPKLHNHLATQLQGNWIPFLHLLHQLLNPQTHHNDENVRKLWDAALLHHADDEEKAWPIVVVAFLVVVEERLYVERKELEEMLAVWEGEGGWWRDMLIGGSGEGFVEAVRVVSQGCDGSVNVDVEMGGRGGDDGEVIREERSGEGKGSVGLGIALSAQE